MKQAIVFYYQGFVRRPQSKLCQRIPAVTTSPRLSEKEIKKKTANLSNVRYSIILQMGINDTTSHKALCISFIKQYGHKIDTLYNLTNVVGKAHWIHKKHITEGIPD